MCPVLNNEVLALLRANRGKQFSKKTIAALVAAGRIDEMLNSECADWIKNSSEATRILAERIERELNEVRLRDLPGITRQRTRTAHRLAA